MTFQTSYAKLLADPEYGHIKKRREHAKRMYIEGMRRAVSIARESDGEGYGGNENAVKDIEQEIAEESK